jgi:hypothetical protein
VTAWSWFEKRNASERRNVQRTKRYPVLRDDFEHCPQPTSRTTWGEQSPCPVVFIGITDYRDEVGRGDYGFSEGLSKLFNHGVIG